MRNSVTNSHFSLSFASFFSEEKMMETFEHAVGPEKYELIAKQQGNDVSILPV